jgi:protein Tex
LPYLIVAVSLLVSNDLRGLDLNEEKTTFNPVPAIAAELSISTSSVEAVISMLADGNTVPFIARYRKEATGTLDEVQIRKIEERNMYLVELDKRRIAILKSVEEQGKLTPELKAKIEGCGDKTTLEDLYLPYKPKRRTKATIAREKGLEPLAKRILAQSEDGDPGAEAAGFVNSENGVEDVESALEHARNIVAEVVAENADVRAFVRERFANTGLLVSKNTPKGEDEAGKYKDYYEYSETVSGIPSHRFLAVRRGEREGVLKLGISVDEDALKTRICRQMSLNERSPFADELATAIQDSYKRLISSSVETDVRVGLKMEADQAAVDVFANNLESLLLAAPFGSKSVIGVDPGLRTGCKCAALDHTGKFLENMTFNIVRGEAGMEQGRREFINFMRKHEPIAIAVGNGTGGRETEKFIRQSVEMAELKGVITVSVNESGASVYSASEIAGQEFPDLDLTIRGAISIGRRLQDPLAELVKIDPKSIGVGQYQHDVHQPMLVRKLGDVVETCVNRVGVELNTASAPLMARVSGIGPKLAQNIVEYREVNGAFNTRKQLLKVAKLGPRAFEQAAGFMRLSSGKNPLDASAVHPERYDLVKRMAVDMGVGLKDLMGDAGVADKIEISRYISDGIGEPTLRDIVDELKKPGRDPRDTFDPPAFRDDVQSMEDLEQGMNLEGIVTNVTAFGAFVDIGVHQDGLVHISKLADRFVKDPNEVVKAGDKIRVHVLEVDIKRRRISLSACGPEQPVQRESHKQHRDEGRTSHPGNARKRRDPAPAPGKFSNNPFADLLKNK